VVYPRFEGEYFRGKNAGSAKVAFVNGDKYNGQMNMGKFHGQGRFDYSNGRGWYKGEYRHGKQHGRGSRLFMNDSRYEGDFLHGAMHGEGMMEWLNGDQYVGEWLEGFPNGRGVYIYAHGDRYEGTEENSEDFHSTNPPPPQVRGRLLQRRVPRPRQIDVR